VSWLEAPIKTRPVTPDEVLERLDDWCECGSWREPLPERDPARVSLRREHGLDYLIGLIDDNDDYDLKPDAETIAELIQVLFGPDLPHEPLVEVLKANGDVGSLCDFIGGHAETEAVEPARIMGQVSWEAGLFRVLRLVLRREGLDVRDVAPSTRLSPYLLRDAGAFERAMNQLAPGRAPAHRLVYPPGVEPAGTILFVGGCVGLAAGMLSLLGLLPSMFAWAFPVALVCFVLWFPLERIKPTAARLGELETFGDLVSALAVHYRGGGERAASPNSRIQ
jgi:hypothetical protein